MRRLIMIVLVAALASCTPGGERDVDRSAVGPTATAGAVSITYPPDTAPLALSADGLVAGWEQAFEGELGAPPVVATNARIDAGSVSDPISLEAVIDAGLVSVVQLALINGSADDDQARSSAAVVAFLELMLPDGGSDVGAAFEGLGFGDSGVLFGLSEDEYTAGGVSFFRASNEDTILIGAVGSP